ncbi:hypothetical protein [Planctomyces sp. SH-PL14]|uniref:hypothetical protein n=1 Tax=Planctomyces sp. SH-PL14 TaxID=1632864 RepID=UPI00078EB79A|nr:hypothetical protein [Planctomyces sp. SH-PL14]AMV16511.1 hypothetical protein VT03_01385 [Planctomyces sp. SH-PL14]
MKRQSRVDEERLWNEIHAFQLGHFAILRDFEHLGDVIPKISRRIGTGALMGLTLTVQRLRTVIRLRTAMEKAVRRGRDEPKATSAAATSILEAHIEGYSEEETFLISDLKKWGCEAFEADDVCQAFFILGRLTASPQGDSTRDFTPEFTRIDNRPRILEVVERALSGGSGGQTVLGELEDAFNKWAGPKTDPVKWAVQNFARKFSDLEKLVLQVLKRRPEEALSGEEVAAALPATKKRGESTVRSALSRLVNAGVIQKNALKAEGRPRGYWLNLS